jgi:protein-L-isoaspartate O-methyltransferase
MHAHAIENLRPYLPAEGGSILDVGSGSGYCKLSDSCRN